MVRRAVALVALLAASVAAAQVRAETPRDRPSESGQLPVPSGFGFDPGLTIRQSYGSFRVAEDVSRYAITGKTYYVGYPGASNANDGLTTNASLANVSAALAKSDVDVVMLYPKTYNRTQGTFPAYSARSVSIRADGGTAIISTHDSLTWTVHSGSAYKATRSAVKWVWDASVVDANGDYQRLANVVDAATVVTTPGSWFADGTTVYVRTSDSRAPDSNVRVHLDVVGGSITGGITVYLEGLQFEGGNPPLRVYAVDGTTKPTVYMKNCAFKYGHSSNGLNAEGADTYCQGCLAARNYLDGFNYHSRLGSTCESVEVNCTARDNGYEGGDTHNGSTTHDAQSIVRVGGRYFRNDGPNVADVNASQSWNLGVYAHDSTGAGAQNTNFHTEGEMWCDFCASSGSTNDLVVGADSTARLRGSALPAQSIDATGTVESY